MTAKPEAPEALFGGVDWDHVHRNILEDRWAVVLHQVEYCIARDHDTGEWSGSFLSLSGENDRTVGNREQVLAWLRTKVIEARDELCRVTGTVAVQGWQPIGTAKDIENRSLKFPRGVTGRVWVHAGVGPGSRKDFTRTSEIMLETLWCARGWMDFESYDMRRDAAGLVEKTLNHSWPTGHGHDFQPRMENLLSLRGHIVGSIEVTSYTENSDSAWYIPGSLAINVRDPQPLATPVPAKGALGWWKVGRHPGLAEQLKEAA